MQVLEASTGKTKYCIGTGNSDSNEKNISGKIEFLCTAASVDIYMSRKHGDEVVFALNPSSGSLIWESDQDGGEFADYNRKSDEVTLLSVGDWGVRFLASTGKQVAVIEVEENTDRKLFFRVNDQWLLDTVILSSKSKKAITRVNTPSVKSAFTVSGS